MSKKVLCLLLAVVMLLSGCKSAAVKEKPAIGAPAQAAPIATEKPEANKPAVSQNKPEPEKTPETLPNTEAGSVAEVIKPQFALGEEFFVQLEAIFEKYGINQSCGGDNCTCDPKGENKILSLYICDLESGAEFNIHGGVHYPVASSVKIPFCVMVYEKLTSGEISADTEITYQKRHYFHGSGIVNKGGYGDVYTVRELLKLAITRSDNTAYMMLRDLVSWDDFASYLEQNGYTHKSDRKKYSQTICNEAAGQSGKMLARFFQSDSEFVDVFKQDLINTRIKMLRSDYPIYRKYGWTNYAFHDTAFVDAPHPYVVSVLSNLSGEEDTDYELIKEISYLVQNAVQNGHASTEA